MCKTTEELPPSTIRADSTISDANSESSWGSNNTPNNNNASDAYPFSNHSRSRNGRSRTLLNDKQFSTLSSSFSEQEEYNNKSTFLVSSLVGGLVAGLAVTGFALWFPFALAPQAASKTYDWAFYHYDAAISHFDNTAWTYGTDYALAVIMATVVTLLLREGQVGVSDKLARRAASLLLGYCVSVTAGGYCHQTYTTLESRNELSFRLLWTLCVGTVSFASCSMGTSGTECLLKFQNNFLTKNNGPSWLPWKNVSLYQIPVIPESFWWMFGIVQTAFVAWGGMSFQRPACDIFIAGITQSPSTFYLMALFALVQHPKVPVKARVIGVVGFILNAPLLPMYPLLIQYTDMSLAAVNTLLHSWLCVAWCMQGYSLWHMIRALNRSAADQQEQIDTVQLTKRQ